MKISVRPNGQTYVYLSPYCHLFEIQKNSYIITLAIPDYMTMGGLQLHSMRALQVKHCH